MEMRTAKLNISRAGGTAAKGAKTCKVTLPGSWLRLMGASEQSRELELAFDGERIILSRRLTCDEFAEQKLARGHCVRRYRFFDGVDLCTTIYADFTDETLAYENHIDDPVKTAFGNNRNPLWTDFLAFLEERCIPRRRSGLREYLDAIGVDGYDPVAIVERTAGRMAEDGQWLEMEALK